MRRSQSASSGGHHLQQREGSRECLDRRRFFLFAREGNRAPPYVTSVKLGGAGGVCGGPTAHWHCTVRGAAAGASRKRMSPEQPPPPSSAYSFHFSE